jgi:hypothetical protein
MRNATDKRMNEKMKARERCTRISFRGLGHIQYLGAFAAQQQRMILQRLPEHEAVLSHAGMPTY